MDFFTRNINPRLYQYHQNRSQITKTMFEEVLNFNINLVFGSEDTKYSIKLPFPTLNMLEKEILAIPEKQFLNARKIFVRDVPLTDNSISQLLKKGATYRVHFNQFENSPELCDVYLFEII